MFLIAFPVDTGIILGFQFPELYCFTGTHRAKTWLNSIRHKILTKASTTLIAANLHPMCAHSFPPHKNTGAVNGTAPVRLFTTSCHDEQHQREHSEKAERLVVHVALLMLCAGRAEASRYLVHPRKLVTDR